MARNGAGCEGDEHGKRERLPIEIVDPPSPAGYGGTSFGFLIGRASQWHDQAFCLGEFFLIPIKG